MTKVNFKDSAIYATRGLFETIASERNIKIQLVIGAIIIFISLLLKIAKPYLITIIIVVFLVVILEMFNRSFEKLIDLISPEYNKEAKKIKDAMAGVVLMAFILTTIVSLLILYNHLMILFKIISENFVIFILMIIDILLTSIVLLTYWIKRINQKLFSHQQS
jgi:diacylglycerol kinase